jgi:hypothetical protein
MVDPTLRWSAQELLNHPLFDDSFKEGFALSMTEWLIEENMYNNDLIE